MNGESVCPYCGVGCRLQFSRHAGRLNVKGVADAPANLGGICAKGALLGPTIDSDDRLKFPHLRRSRQDYFQRVDWQDAFQHVADSFQRIMQTHGPQAVAFYGSGQLDTQTDYIVCKLFKGTLGCNNTDSNSRLCMASAVAGYNTSLGSDGPPTCYDDIESADLIVLIGSNMAEAHPVIFDRLRAAKKARPELQIVVIDPRRTATAGLADQFLPVAPGGDIAMFNVLGRMLLDMGAVDRNFVADHSRGFSEYREFLLEQNLNELCRVAGLEAEQLAQLARRIAHAKGLLSFYCMGMNQSTVGMWKNNSLINLHLLTGQIGKPGAGPFSLTGQPNAMGGRESGLLCQHLPGYRFVKDTQHRREVEAFWGRPEGSIDPEIGLSALEMFQALEKGTLKAIWIAGTNPVVSMPDLHHIRRALQKAELVVVQDAYHPTETTRMADVILPAAQWGEKEWTSTNSERMVSHSPKLWDAPGEALPDWEILARFAQTMGLQGFDFKDASEVWDEFTQLTGGRPCDMAGATSERLRRVKNLQWPCPSVDHPGSKRRYLDKRFATADGKAIFLPRPHRDPCERTDHEFPFVLTTGRLYAHWHSMTRTNKVEKLVKREPEPFVEIHPHDAAALNVANGEMLQITSRRGTVRLPARLRDGVLRGTIFVPFHWGDMFQEGNAANYLTISAMGRVAKQPELKFCAVALEKVPATQPRKARQPRIRELALVAANPET